MVSTDILCLGGATIDRKLRAARPLTPGTSNPVEGSRSFGGVARNVCENLLRLGVGAGLATIVGGDEGGRALIADLAALGADVSAIEVAEARRTAEYVAALDPDGGLAFGLADMGVLDGLDLDWLGRLRLRLDGARWVFADCNLAAPAFAALIGMARGAGFRLAVDPVSVAKAARLPANLAGVDLIVLNRDEAEALTGEGDPMRAVGSLIRRGASSAVLTDGAGPIHIAGSGGDAVLPACPATVADVTGAGDALIAAILAGLDAGRPLAGAVEAATRIAALTVGSTATVRPDLSPDRLQPGRRSAA